MPWRRDRLLTPVFLGFPGGSAGEESACNAGDLDSIPELGRSPGEGNSYPLQYSCLKNPHGQRSLAGYSPCGCKESNTTEATSPLEHMDPCTCILSSVQSLIVAGMGQKVPVGLKAPGCNRLDAIPVTLLTSMSPKGSLFQVHVIVGHGPLQGTLHPN